jgi:hypothetical protein
MWSCSELTACGLVIISNRTLLSHCAKRDTMQDSMGKIKNEGMRKEADSSEENKRGCEGRVAMF